MFIALRRAFKKKWLVQMSAALLHQQQKQQLQGLTLMDRDISKWQQMENGGDFMHNLWVKNVVKLATQVRDPDGALIDFVINNTLCLLREYLQDKYNSWEEFAQAIQAIPVDCLLADCKH